MSSIGRDIFWNSPFHNLEDRSHNSENKYNESDCCVVLKNVNCPVLCFLRHNFWLQNCNFPSPKNFKSDGFVGLHLKSLFMYKLNFSLWFYLYKTSPRKAFQTFCLVSSKTSQTLQGFSFWLVFLCWSLRKLSKTAGLFFWEWKTSPAKYTRLVKIKYTRLISHNAASIASILKIQLS